MRELCRSTQSAFGGRLAALDRVDFGRARGHFRVEIELAAVREGGIGFDSVIGQDLPERHPRRLSGVDRLRTSAGYYIDGSSHRNMTRFIDEDNESHHIHPAFHLHGAGMHV